MATRIAALALALSALTAPAQAAPPPEEFAFGSGAGTGRMWPGVPSTGCISHVEVEFTIFGDVYTYSRPSTSPFGATFTGSSSICATIHNDMGAGSMSGGINGNVTYVRTGQAVTLSGTVSVVGFGTRTLDGRCWWAGTFAPGATFSPYCWIVLDL